jgi:hypothetical protein
VTYLAYSYDIGGEVAHICPKCYKEQFQGYEPDYLLAGLNGDTLTCFTCKGVIQ